MTSQLPSPNRTALLFWVTLLFISLAELVTSLLQPIAGLSLHALLLLALLIYSGLAQAEAERRLAYALTLAPLIRLLSLSLPLPRLPQIAWYPAVSILLLMAVWLISRQLRLTRRELGLQAGHPALEMALALGGLGLGALEYLILRPQAQPGPMSLAFFLLYTLSLLIFTGFAEELIFRGLLQSLALPILGQWGLIYIALLFGVLHIGYLSLLDVVFVTAVGLLFAQIVRWSGSIIGVTMAHGSTNVVLFLVLPTLAAEQEGAIELVTAGLIFTGALAFIIVTGVLSLRVTVAAGQEPANVDGRLIASTRRGLGLTYTALAQLAGLSSRRLAEIEQGRAVPRPDEIERISAALGLVMADNGQPMTTTPSVVGRPSS